MRKIVTTRCYVTFSFFFFFSFPPSRMTLWKWARKIFAGRISGEYRAKWRRNIFDFLRLRFRTRSMKFRALPSPSLKNEISFPSTNYSIVRWRQTTFTNNWESSWRESRLLPEDLSVGFDWILGLDSRVLANELVWLCSVIKRDISFFFMSRRGTRVGYFWVWFMDVIWAVCKNFIVDCWNDYY